MESWLVRVKTLYDILLNRIWHWQSTERYYREDELIYLNH